MLDQWNIFGKDFAIPEITKPQEILHEKSSDQ
jgi:hypothetical protein